MSDFNFQTFNFGLTAAARAQETTPNKPIKFIVPYPAGAGNDILARMVGQKMSEKFGQPVVVENRPGAAGNIGLDYLARAPGDGYSIAIADTGPLAINTSLYTKLSFSPTRDFAAVKGSASRTKGAAFDFFRSFEFKSTAATFFRAFSPPSLFPNSSFKRHTR